MENKNFIKNYDKFFFLIEFKLFEFSKSFFKNLYFFFRGQKWLFTAGSRRKK